MTDVATRLEATTDRVVKVELTVDAELLDEARRQIGADSIDAAVGEALRRLVDQERGKRNEARAKLRRMYDDGLFEFGPDEEDGE